MAENLPYMVSPGSIPKILSKMTEARRPERFTQDFLETKLGFPGGNQRAMIPLLKRIGFLASDGTPTDLYDRYRNPDSQMQAMAEGLRKGYRELFDRNDYAYNMPRDKLKALVLQITGLEKDNRVAEAMVSTFFALKETADFEASAEPRPVALLRAEAEQSRQEEPRQPRVDAANLGGSPRLNLAYTINLNLPESTNPDVFNAIFRALKENLLEA
jgi:hypothetical protein